MSDNKIPTIKYLWENELYLSTNDNLYREVKKMIKKYTKLHVEAALKASKDKGKIIYASMPGKGPGYFRAGEITQAWVDKESILNAYPIDNIK